MSQSNSITAILRDTIKRQGIKGLYSGSGALITGNGLKAGVRFLCYDNFKELVRNGDAVSRALMTEARARNLTDG